MSDAEILQKLYRTIAARKGADPETSYTAKLFAKGRAKIAQKLGEEAVETVVAAVSQGKPELISESADLLYHLLVLWADSGIAPEEVFRALETRQGMSGIEEKRNRS